MPKNLYGKRGGSLWEAGVPAPPYGLAAGIQTGDLGRALRLADRIRAGTVWLNTWHKYYPSAPFGGYGMSGYGREQGREAWESYTQYKTIWANLA